MNAREVPEWGGTTPITMPPTRIRLRAFERYDGRCHKRGRKIMPNDKWCLYYAIATINSDKNHERNLAPLLVDKRRGKTCKVARTKAKTERVRGKHFGSAPKARDWNLTMKQKLDGAAVRRTAK